MSIYIRRATVAAGALGASALLVGYFAPVWFDPDATLAPLTGVFVTGPLWMAGGVVFGIIAAARRMTQRRFAIGLTILVLLAIVSSAAISLPEDRFEARLIEGEIVRCSAPLAFVPAAIARWRTLPGLRPGWREDVERMLDSSRGAVLTVHVTRTVELYRSKKPWSAGQLVSRGWQAADKTEEFFASYAGDNCTAYRTGSRGRYRVEWQLSDVSPPDVLPSFLGLQIVIPATQVPRPVAARTTKVAAAAPALRNRCDG